MVNSGGSSGSYNVALRINGKVEQQRIVQVSPGSAHPVKFTVTKSEPGTYTVAVDGKKASFTVIGADGKTSGPAESGGLIAILIMGVLILATVVVLLVTFRRTA